MSELLSLDKLQKAYKIFEEFRCDMITDRDKAGATQAFEFCYELTWKTLKRALSLRGIESASPRDTFRKAAQEKIIDDPELWFDIQQKRNLTSHTCEHENLEKVVSIFDVFSKELSKIIKRIEELE